jgi:2-dehydro-3-deoxygalactonokinase
MTVPGIPAFTGVDWGTTALRLWTFARDGRVLAERRGTEGMGSLTPDGFAPVLEAHLAALAIPPDAPVLMCGMVGAKQGWLPAPYLDVPSTVDGLAAAAVRVPSSRDIRILPGLANRSDGAADVMRGEETKLAGLAATSPSDCLVCLTGTHTKWVRLSGGRVAAFRTTMAGELFALLRSHSILRLTLGDSSPAVAADDPVFLDGARRGLAAPGAYTTDLFGIRAANLLGGLDAAGAAARLSGLLIGAAVAHGLALSDSAALPVVLVADDRLGPLYAAALELLGRSVEHADADAAVQQGLSAAARHLWPGRFSARE